MTYAAVGNGKGYRARMMRRVERLRSHAVRMAREHEHDLSPFRFEEDGTAAAAGCERCWMVAAIDATEAPHLFGRALTEKCKGHK